MLLEGCNNSKGSGIRTRNMCSERGLPRVGMFVLEQITVRSKIMSPGMLERNRLFPGGTDLSYTTPSAD